MEPAAVKAKEDRLVRHIAGIDPDGGAAVAPGVESDHYVLICNGAERRRLGVRARARHRQAPL
jgi:hypothetical protein